MSSHISATRFRTLLGATVACGILVGALVMCGCSAGSTSRQGESAEQRVSPTETGAYEPIEIHGTAADRLDNPSESGLTLAEAISRSGLNVSLVTLKSAVQLLRFFVLALSPVDKELQIDMEFQHNEAIKRYLMHDKEALSCLPRLSVAEELDSKKMFEARIIGHRFEREFRLIWRKEKTLTRVMRDFKRYVSELRIV